jgi:hypothetical protein
MKKMFGFTAVCFLLAACSDPPKPQTFSLTPETAHQALRYDARAETWLAHAKKQNPTCTYELEIPDQSNHPSELDFSHIMKCSGQTAPRELDASVSFMFDKASQHWVITRFSY